ncbi:MAG TPA: glycosyltransferase [Opitutaceae bacterium]|nr:glycosyltransferase [Opitutaceae bacterium]
MNIVILGLSITSSWGNGHATTYRGLVRELAARGHEVLFLERDVRWYAANRDLPRAPGAEVALYRSLAQLQRQHADAIREADAVIVGSYVPQGIEVGEWVLATARGVVGFYDIDTPVTLAQLARGACEYLSLELIPRYHVYLSFTGGPLLRRLEREFGSPMARPLYCSVDPRAYYPEPEDPVWDCGYLGTYSPDRQPRLEELMLRPARRWRGGCFVVAGPQYPRGVRWPANVERIDHVAPAHHRAFYNRQRFTLNITRADMIAAGYSPSVRLFEAAACGVPIISDSWTGLEEFFEPGTEILVAGSTAEALDLLRNLGRGEGHRIGLAARRRVLAAHTAAHRALELETHLREAMQAGEIDDARILSA